ncbi:conserved hypothetical protein [Photorhabdus asymbiotica]|uniref:Uncharacterized protein n=1 Tax=Photorhabdus asymbiotica subsp. asymbiotica (strain ATCC 43949 / 3105-77) TaxID=553480 RepID=B6VM44_PHOAA|nr:conserved hypothetical protein [Photorhabdus asymbiotica]CAR67224.1 Hypothetical Protein PA-RVA11-2279 [Photorhabdus asymbiotica subsp. asymbiotica ATCC 43949]
MMNVLLVYTLHPSSCCFVGCFHSPQSHSYLCSWGFVYLPPRCNSKFIGYREYLPNFKGNKKILMLALFKNHLHQGGLLSYDLIYKIFVLDGQLLKMVCLAHLLKRI